MQQAKGMFTINGGEHTARAGCWFFLPWVHAIEYAADPADPFLVGGIHVIPEHDHSYPVRNRVAYDKDDLHAGAKYRRIFSSATPDSPRGNTADAKGSCSRAPHLN